MSRKGKITLVVKNHPGVSYPLRPHSDSALPGTNEDHHNPPHTTGNQTKNKKMLPALPKSASALPGDVGNESGAIMCPISTAPTPREFQDTGGTGKNRGGNAKTPLASPECASVLPGDVGSDWVHNCTLFRRH